MTRKTANPRTQHVLLADDGSGNAAAARDAAIAAAAAAGAKLTLLYVREPLETLDDGKARLAEATRLADRAGLGCEIIIERPVGVSSPGRRIVESARRVGADLIVVGARGKGALARTLLGSVSEHVVRHARVSVLVARGHGH